MTLRQFIQSLFPRAAPLRSFNEENLTDHPYDLFTQWFEEAHRSGLYLPEAMTLSTVNPDGQPSSRMVLLKGHSRDGFDFFTNLNSRKSVDIQQNQKCALLFHWNLLHRQIRIEGDAHPLPSDQADEYFASRPRESQVGAWASDQSQPLSSRKELEERIREIEERYKSRPVPRPPHWSGYKVTPATYEFWQGRAGRIHDRFLYQTNQNQWGKIRLSP